MWEISFRWLLDSVVAWFRNKTASLTLYEKLSLIISLFGIISLILIYLQTRLISTQNTLIYAQNTLIFTQISQTTKSMQYSMYASMANQTLELDKIFIQKPQLRPYFYGGKDISKDNKNYELVFAVAEFELDYFDSIMTHLDYVPPDKDATEDKETWDHYFADSFARSPAMCKRVNSNCDWYMESLLTIACENCKKIGVKFDCEKCKKIDCETCTKID